MKTTLHLDEELLQQARAYAFRSGITLSEFIADALRASMARFEASSHRDCVKLPVSQGSGLQSGVDLDRSASLLDLMEVPIDE